MALQQCLPGKVVPHHCQLLSNRQKWDGESRSYLLIKQLKTLALRVTQRNNYLWVCMLFTAKLSVKMLKLSDYVHLQTWSLSISAWVQVKIILTSAVGQGLNNLTLKGSFHWVCSLTLSLVTVTGIFSFLFPPLFFFFYFHLHKLRLTVGGGQKWGSNQGASKQFNNLLLLPPESLGLIHINS